MYLARTVAPTGQILTLDEVKAQLRIPFTDEDALLADYVQLATEYLEGFNGRAGYLGRALLTQIFELRLDEFPSNSTAYPPGAYPTYSMAAPIVLPMPPLQSVTGIQYLDGALTLQTMDPATYTAETAMLQGRITLPQGQAWPDDVAQQQDAVRITFVAGYGPTAASLPAGIRQAAKLLIGMYYLNREGGTDTKGGFGFALDALLSQHRIPGF